MANSSINKNSLSAHETSVMSLYLIAFILCVEVWFCLWALPFPDLWT